MVKGRNTELREASQKLERISWVTMDEQEFIKHRTATSIIAPAFKDTSFTSVYHFTVSM